MRRVPPIVGSLIVALIGLYLVPAAAADSIYNFSINTTGTLGSNVPGVITGTIDLPFVSPGGSGSGMASSVVLTSIPSALINGGFEAISSGNNADNNATAWAHQGMNAFTVTDGVITRTDFFAATAPITADAFCMNNIGLDSFFGVYICNIGEDFLGAPGGEFAINYVYQGGVVFTPVSAAPVPEPETMDLLLIGLGVWGMMLAVRGSRHFSRRVVLAVSNGHSLPLERQLENRFELQSANEVWTAVYTSFAPRQY